jgi:hypothetical protein
MGSVAAVVRPDQPLHFLGGVEPAAVFYSDRNITAVRRGDPLPSNAYVLLWERDWLALGAGPRLPAPLKVSATKLPGRGHLLLIAAPTERFWQREAPSSGAQPPVENAQREDDIRPNEPAELRSREGQ